MKSKGARKPPTGRNVINGKALSTAIGQRALDAGISLPVQQWLQRQFSSWLINNFTEIQKVIDPSAYKRFTGKKAPDWYLAKYKNPEHTFWFIDPEHEQLKIMESKLVEWLEPRSSTDLAKKFSRMTPSQILKKWEDDHQRFITNQKNGLLDTSGEAMREVMNVDEMVVVEFDAKHPEFRTELFNESQMMQHCIGQFESRQKLAGGYGEYYARAAETDQLRLFSIRTSTGRAHVTISVEPGKKGKWFVEQVKGKQNRPPILRYVSVVKQFLNHHTFQHDDNYDCGTMGLFYENGATVTLNEITDSSQIVSALIKNPSLISMLDAPTATQEWIAILEAPLTIGDVKEPGIATRIMSYLLDPFSGDEAKRDDILSTWVTGKEALSIDGEKIAFPPLYMGKNVG